MLELCNILEISVNDLLNGEMVNEKNYIIKAEKDLTEFKKSSEKLSKQFLNLEIGVGVTGTFSFLTLWLVASFSELNAVVKFIMMFAAVMLLISTIICTLKIEQVAGYYKCSNCGHKYVPTFGNVALAVHIGRSRCLVCPKCQKLSWHKKVISKGK